MKTDTSEKGLESLIMRHLTGTDGLAPTTIDHLADAPAPIGGSGWIAGYAAGDDRAHATDGESRQFNFHGQHKMKTDLIQSLTYTFEAHAQQTEGGVEF